MSDIAAEEEEEGWYRAVNYNTLFCPDPTCGLHFFALNEEHQPVCEIVLSIPQTRKLIEYCEEQLLLKGEHTGRTH